MSDELPQGWVETTLGEVVADISYGFTAKAACSANGPRYLRITDIQNNAVDWASVPSCSIPPERIPAYQLLSGDLVFARTGATTGKSFLVRACPEAIFASYLIRVRPASSLVPEFIASFFRSASYWNQISENISGSAQPNCNATKLSSLVVPIPPLPEQRRIVAKLEKLLGQVDACQQRLAKIPTLLKRFRQSVLAAACSGRLTADWREENPDVDDASGLVAELERMHEAAGGHKKGNAAPPSDEAHDLSAEDLPSSWRLTEMRSVVCPDRPVTYGILKPGPDTPGGIPYVRVADFPNDRLNLKTIRRTTKEIEKTFARARLRAGDILLSIRGTVGRVCVVPKDLKDANITQDTARLSVQPALNAGFVKWFLRAAPTQTRMQKAVKGVAVRGINIGDVRALQMPVPPFPEQQEILRRVESLLSLADQIESRLAAAQRQVDALTPSLLARAFAGKLVPQDPTDEPAEMLLEYIRRQKP